MGFPGGTVVKNPPANVGDSRDAGSIPGLRRAPAEGNGSPLQYSCLENPMNRGAWGATVHGVAKSQTRLKRLNTSTTDYGKGDGISSPQLCFALQDSISAVW